MEINLRKIYNSVKSMPENSDLEQFAKQQLLDMFPREPEHAYASYENDAYASAYNMMVPDVEFDSDDYDEWLCEKTQDVEFSRECSRRFKKIERTVTFYNLF